MRDRATTCILALLVISTTGCTTLIARKLNQRFPPVQSIDKQLQATEETLASARQAKATNLYAYVTPQDVVEDFTVALSEPMTSADDNYEYEVRLDRPAVTIGVQDVRTEADFEVRLHDRKKDRDLIVINGHAAAHATPTVVTTTNGPSIGFRATGERLHLSNIFPEGQYGWLWWITKRQAVLTSARETRELDARPHQRTNP